MAQKIISNSKITSTTHTYQWPDSSFLLRQCLYPKWQCGRSAFCHLYSPDLLGCQSSDPRPALVAQIQAIPRCRLRQGSDSDAKTNTTVLGVLEG